MFEFDQYSAELAELKKGLLELRDSL